MLTDRSGKSRSPSFVRKPSPVPALKLKTEPKLRASVSPTRYTPPKTERKSPNKLQTMFKQVCCPNCRYLFKVIKDDSLLTQGRHHQPTTHTLNVETQTLDIVTRDIAIITKEIQAILLPSSFDNIELPRFDQQSRITRKTSPAVSGNFTPQRIYRRTNEGSADGVTSQKRLKELYIRMSERQHLLQQIIQWLRREPPGTVGQIPSYIKTLIDT